MIYQVLITFLLIALFLSKGHCSSYSFYAGAIKAFSIDSEEEEETVAIRTAHRDYAVYKETVTTTTTATATSHDAHSVFNKFLVLDALLFTSTVSSLDRAKSMLAALPRSPSALRLVRTCARVGNLAMLKYLIEEYDAFELLSCKSHRSHLLSQLFTLAAEADRVHVLKYLIEESNLPCQYFPSFKYLGLLMRCLDLIRVAEDVEFKAQFDALWRGGSGLRLSRGHQYLQSCIKTFFFWRGVKYTRAYFKELARVSADKGDWGCLEEFFGDDYLRERWNCFFVKSGDDDVMVVERWFGSFLGEGELQVFLKKIRSEVK